MKNTLKFIILPAAILLCGAYVAAAETPSAETIEKYSGLFQWFLGICIVAIGFFLNKTLNTMERNNEKQWGAIYKLNSRVANIEGHLNYGRREADE